MRFGVHVRSRWFVREAWMPAVTKNEYDVWWQAQDMGIGVYYNACLIWREPDSVVTSYYLEQISM